jgi:hypothetical protein
MAYCDLWQKLQGGSGGGSGWDGSGGGGGGAIEIGAVRSLVIAHYPVDPDGGAIGPPGLIFAKGGDANFYTGAGGSGGGIFLHANSVTNSGGLLANGGNGSPFYFLPGPGGGPLYESGVAGEGRITILYDSGGFVNDGAIFGLLEVAEVPNLVPQPTALVPMGTGILVVFGVCWIRRRRVHLSTAMNAPA